MKIPLFLFTWVVLMPLVILSGKHVALVCGVCQNDQQTFLLQLKSSLSFVELMSGKLVTWNSSTDCCMWKGIACDPGGEGHVIGLDLSGEQINGGIENSTGLYRLQFLQSLNLSFNNFRTTVPARLGNLTNIIHLNLSNAGFIGQVPAEISQMERLITLDLSNAYSAGNRSLKLEEPNIETLVQNLQQLTGLRLDGVNMSAAGKEWCSAVSNLPKLRELSLSICFLSGPIDDSLQKLQSLSVINLSGNNLSTQVPEFFASFSKLTVLRLSSCNLQGKFPEKIFQLPSLKLVDLSNNKLLQGSFPEFSLNLSIQTLILSSTSFSGTIPPSIGNLSKIVYLDLSFNSFSGAIPSFNMTKNITYIDLSHNQLTGEISSTHWEDLVKLVYLDLGNNSLNGSIPVSLFAIPLLQKVQLSLNHFGGQISETPNVSSFLLDTLDLSSNKLEGTIPNFVFDLGGLSVLLLSSNKFNGTMQLDLVRKLGNLTKLDLSYNNLMVNASIASSVESAFPQFSTLKLASCNLKMFPDLRNQTKLFQLDLSDNLIAGQVPSWISEVGGGSLIYLNLSRNLLVGLQSPLSLPILSILDLHRNRFQGNIPTLPSSASFVDYSSNNFTSFIPPNIGNNLSYTLFFSLSNNNLSGAIPESMCKASYLQVLDLSNNKLSGKIPSCLIERSRTLGVLNLRRNSFDGDIPDNFPSFCALKTLDLSGNLFKGKVPESLANCSMLEVLDLGNNQINDVFPGILKAITSLRVVVVRDNNFYGPIGCPTLNSTWRNLQIIDLASNNFNGTLPQACFNTWDAMITDENEIHDHLRFQFLGFNGGAYYQDSVRVTVKGLELELVKILTVFASIDFSCNKFEGKIPTVIGQLNALFALNFSHNALSGQIPSVLGNLSQLESLDLSNNNLTGEIPQQLAHLTFLSALNLSNNRLSGMIPTGTQIQTFSADSFEGNQGLCGLPLTNSCSDRYNPNTGAPEHHDGRNKLDWQYIIPGMAFGLGAGAAVAPLLICKEVQNLYDDSIDKILLLLFPMLGLKYYTRNDWRIQPENSSEDEESDVGEEEEEEEDDIDCLGGRYCVYCTKLDITRKQAIHDPKCTCFHSPPITSSSSSFSSSSS